MKTACVGKPARESYDSGQLGQLGPFRRATSVVPSLAIRAICCGRDVSISLRIIPRVILHVLCVEFLDDVPGGV